MNVFLDILLICSYYTKCLLLDIKILTYQNVLKFVFDLYKISNMKFPQHSKFQFDKYRFIKNKEIAKFNANVIVNAIAAPFIPNKGMNKTVSRILMIPHTIPIRKGI